MRAILCSLELKLRVITQKTVRTNRLLGQRDLSVEGLYLQMAQLGVDGINPDVRGGNSLCLDDQEKEVL